MGARCSIAASRRWRLLASRVPLVGEVVDSGAVESYRGLPKQVYKELYLVPWILMDTGWSCINYRATQGMTEPTGVVLRGAFFGALSIALQLDCLTLSANTS